MPTPGPHQPGPQQTGRYTLEEREVSIFDDEGKPQNLGTLTLLLDSATGEVSYLVRDGNGLSWRTVPRPPGPPHHPPAPHLPSPNPGGPWPAPSLPMNPPAAAPYQPGTSLVPVPPGVPSLSPPSLPIAPPGAPVPSGDPFTSGGTVPAPAANPLVDPAGFRESVSEAERLRAERRVGEAAFVALATRGAVILDCRSREKFDRLHVRGAVNLPFPDITAEELARIIPSPDTRVLLYCNNNFADAPAAFPAKVAAAALNHHSFATLVSYGYRNVFELGPLVDVASTEIPLEGSDAP